MSLTIGPPIVLERVIRVAAMGIRFVDPVTAYFVSELVVTARPVVAPYAPPLELQPNRSGIFVLHRDVTPGTWVLTVSDPSGRFLPFTLQVDVPTHGLYFWTVGSPVEAESASGAVPLFSTPSRAPAEGMAIVRADIFDLMANKPAASAILEVRYLGQLLGRGLADERGQVAVTLPYPPPVGSLQASPPNTLSPPRGGSFFDQTWTVDVDVAYAPGLTGHAESDPVDLGAVFAQLRQPPANVWDDAAQSRRLSSATLTSGQDLILRTSMTPRLLITPAGSPP